MRDRLASVVEDLAATRDRVLVAVDGPDAAGKTTLADSLASAVRSPVVRASVDGFAAPPAVRHARGSLSPEGCYLDGTDRASLADRLLRPFAAGCPTVVTSVRDARTDDTSVVEVPVPPRAVLLVDGVFLLRPQLRSHWSFAIHLHVPPAESLRRGVDRDAEQFGSREATAERYRLRYLPAQELYGAEAHPQQGADVVLDMTDVERPRVLAWRVG